ncbi:MAG: hypothetical protein H0U70_10800 [Tatlockia sp.]|nr:hypothetical protein [Tatlockia sp.]
MTLELNNLERWIKDMAALMEQSAELDPQHYAPFLQDPELALSLVDLIESLDDSQFDDEPAFYSACVFALDICVAQLQTALERGNKPASKMLNLLMSKIAKSITKGKQTLGFWLPVLNAFYEVHAELSEELKEAYLELTSLEEELAPDNEADQLNAMRAMLDELSDLSVFDVAENFFAQSYAMPADFFIDLILDLYSIEEGQDVALLTLLHPKQEVRDVVMATLDQLMATITLSSISLSRLQTIKSWYPESYQEQFNQWIKIQRRKGVVFSKDTTKPRMRIKASEIDGSGAQGIFIHVKKTANTHLLCGLLFKQELGIKDAWLTPELPASGVAKYYDEALDDSVSLREIDEAYLLRLTGHFLALTINQKAMPDLHLLEIQELLGLHFEAKLIDIPHLIEQLSVQIAPFTADAMQSSFKRSKNWLDTKRFAESWFVENAHVDKLVNRFCSYVEGAKVCLVKDAMAVVFSQEFEKQRDKWLFHFLWNALWVGANKLKTEKVWQDCFFIAYAIHQGQPLESIPLMREVCQQTVLNSIDTMQDRRTYLTKE